MMRREMLVGALVLVALAVPSAALAQEEVSLVVTSVDGRDVSLQMTLPDPEGRYPADTRVDASMTVNGRVLPASAALVQPEEGPQRVVVLVTDVSGSMAGAPMRSARAAADQYLGRLPEDVETGLVTFAETVVPVVAPQPDRSVIQDALGATRPAGDTRLFDAIGAALAQIPAGAEGRLVVLSDGQDTVSSTTLGQVVDEASAAGVPIDMVLLAPSAADRAVATRLAGGTGGSVSTAATADGLLAAFEQAASAYGTRVDVEATVPGDLAADGALAIATVSLGGDVVEQSVVLPDVSSLAGPSVDTGVLGVDEVPVASLGPMGTSWAAVFLAGLMALAVGALAAGLAARSRRRAAQARIDQVLAYSLRADRGGGTGADDRGLWGRFEERLMNAGFGRRLQGRLVALGMHVSPARWLLIEALSVIATMLLLWVLLQSPLLAAVVAPIIVILGFEAFLRSGVRRRQRAFEEELPDFLLMLSSALRAGLSFTQSLESSANEHRGEVGRQIRRVLAETQVSSRLDEALLSCADRMDNEDLRWTVTALSVQREVGGNLSSILDGAAATIKGRRALRREVRTLSAEGRLSAYVLIALPLGVLAFLVIFRREYISLLWSDPLGIAMLIALVILFVIGWFWMRAIVRIRV